MRKFDPWPVFFRREWNRNWPFLVGFAFTGTIITLYSRSLTEEVTLRSEAQEEVNFCKPTELQIHSLFGRTDLLAVVFTASNNRRVAVALT